MRELERAQRMVLRIREALLEEKAWTMPLEKCGELGSDLGVDAKRFVARYPRIFKIVEPSSGAAVECVTLSRQARASVEDERSAAKDPYCIYVLRKLLMLSRNERIPTIKLMRNRCFNFPGGLIQKILTQHPSYFHWDKRPLSKWGMLRLVSWDEDLALPIRHKTLDLLTSKPGEEAIESDHLPELEAVVPVENECGIEMVAPAKELLQLHKLPLLSPYDRSHFAAGNKAVERKRKIGLFHEFLSLVKLKKACLSDLLDMKDEFELGDESLVEPFLKKEKSFFIVKQFQGRPHVFLREGYDWDHHPELSPCLQAKKRFLNLMTTEDEDRLAA